MNAAFSNIWYAPAFSGLLISRREGLMIIGAGALHIGLSLAGSPAWNCPMLAATGVPCPGCGLTRAILEFVHGDFYNALQTHAFAPIFLFVGLIFFVTLVLPDKHRIPLIQKITRFESRTGITAWVLSSLIFYWAIRLIIKI